MPRPIRRLRWYIGAAARSGDLRDDAPRARGVFRSGDLLVCGAVRRRHWHDCATYLTGVVSDRYSFEPILIGASIIPVVAMAAVLLLVRNNEATRRGVVSAI